MSPPCCRRSREEPSRARAWMSTSMNRRFPLLCARCRMWFFFPTSDRPRFKRVAKAHGTRVTPGEGAANRSRFGRGAVLTADMTLSGVALSRSLGAGRGSFASHLDYVSAEVVRASLVSMISDTSRTTSSIG